MNLMLVRKKNNLSRKPVVVSVLVAILPSKGLKMLFFKPSSPICQVKLPLVPTLISSNFVKQKNISTETMQKSFVVLQKFR